MRDKDQAKEQVTHELAEAPKNIAELEVSETQRKRAEEKLKREKGRAEEYLNIAGVMLATVDANENISMINKKGCEILGYNQEELIGRNWFDTLIPHRRRGEIRGVFRKLMAGDIEPVEYYENPLLTKDGEERLILFHNTVIRSPNGQIRGALTSGEDITERKRMEQELREERDRLGAFSRLLEAKIDDRNKEIAELRQFLQELTDSRGRFTELKPTENEEAPLIPHTLYQALVYIYSENMHNRKPMYTDLQSALGISRTTARQRINELERLRLISIENSGRSKFLTVTMEGKNMIL